MASLSSGERHRGRTTLAGSPHLGTGRACTWPGWPGWAPRRRRCAGTPPGWRPPSWAGCAAGAAVAWTPAIAWQAPCPPRPGCQRWPRPAAGLAWRLLRERSQTRTRRQGRLPPGSMLSHGCSCCHGTASQPGDGVVNVKSTVALDSTLGCSRLQAALEEQSVAERIFSLGSRDLAKRGSRNRLPAETGFGGRHLLPRELASKAARRARGRVLLKFVQTDLVGARTVQARVSSAPCRTHPARADASQVKIEQAGHEAHSPTTVSPWLACASCKRK
jgi:hypothetical protein